MDKLTPIETTSSEKEKCPNCLEQMTLHSLCLDCIVDIGKSAQIEIEISDEDIEKVAKEYVLYNESKRNWVVEGMKLYREKLKNLKKRQ